MRLKMTREWLEDMPGSKGIGTQAPQIQAALAQVIADNVPVTPFLIGGVLVGFKKQPNMGMLYVLWLKKEDDPERTTVSELVLAGTRKSGPAEWIVPIAGGEDALLPRGYGWVRGIPVDLAPGDDVTWKIVDETEPATETTKETLIAIGRELFEKPLTVRLRDKRGRTSEAATLVLPAKDAK